MASMVVRNIPDDVFERFKKQAKADGKSAEQLAREAIAEKAKPSREEVIRRIDAIRARSKPVDRATAERLWEEHRRERDARPFDPTLDDDY
jgi:plasmid stability protein